MADEGAHVTRRLEYGEVVLRRIDDIAAFSDQPRVLYGKVRALEMTLHRYIRDDEEYKSNTEEVMSSLDMARLAARQGGQLDEAKLLEDLFKKGDALVDAAYKYRFLPMIARGTKSGKKI